MSNDPVPTPTRAKPKVVTWFKVYAAMLCLVYVGVAGASVLFFRLDPTTFDMTQPMAYGVGASLLATGTVLSIACLLPLFLGPRPWVWIYDLALICLGICSPVFLPACIPLLIYWLKPETKSYFGRS